MGEPIEIDEVFIKAPPSENLTLFKKQLMTIFIKYGVDVDSDFFRDILVEVKHLYEAVTNIRWLMRTLKDYSMEQMDKDG